VAKVIPSTEYEAVVEQASAASAAKALGAKEGKVFMVPPGDILLLEGYNLRITGTPEYDAGIKVLAESMAENGFYFDKPLSVMPIKQESGSGFVVTDGHRRLAAALMAIEMGAKIETVPCIAVKAGTNLEDATIAMMQNGEPLSPYERAIGVARLIKANMDEGQIAKRLGVTKQYVIDLLTLTSMPAAIRNMVMAGKVSAGTAIKEFRKDSKSAVERLRNAVDTVAAKGKTRATAKDIEKAPPKEKAEPGTSNRGRKPNPLRNEFEFEVQEGESVLLADIEIFKGFGGGEWYRLSEVEGEAIITQGIKIVGVCTLAPPLPGEQVAAPPPSLPPKPGRKKKGEPPAEVPAVAGTEDL
jgi:ParB/RepB/Spo0J family partition protein